MDAAVLGEGLPEVTQKPCLGPCSLSLQCRHRESLKVGAGLAFCEMLSRYPQSAFQGFSGSLRGGSAAVCDPNPARPFARSRNWCLPSLPESPKYDLQREIYGHGGLPAELKITADLFSRVLFSFLPPFLATPLPPLFSA